MVGVLGSSGRSVSRSSVRASNAGQSLGVWIFNGVLSLSSQARLGGT